MLVPIADAAVCLVVALAALGLSRGLRARTAVGGSAGCGPPVSAAQYSVFVSCLPADVSLSDLVQHFHGLYNLHGQDWVFRGWWRCVGRKIRRRPTQADSYADAEVRLRCKPAPLHATMTLRSAPALFARVGFW
jgi:hypothetical protein